MSPLLKIRAERDQMSAIERRIADFLLENAHLLRDYSSQQLADALNVSQSSVVKFSQKLGFKGYPDLKYSIGEAVARDNGSAQSATARAVAEHPHVVLSGDLWLSKAHAEEETRHINTAEQIDEIAGMLRSAGTVFAIGLGEDGLCARAFASRLSLLGIAAVHETDAALMTSSLSRAGERDVLLVFSEHGKEAALHQLARAFRERHGKVISATRHTANPLRAQADAALLVSAHDERPHIEILLYRSALQHLLDLIFVLMCEGADDGLTRLAGNLERIRRLVEP